MKKALIAILLTALILVSPVTLASSFTPIQEENTVVTYDNGTWIVYANGTFSSALLGGVIGNFTIPYTRFKITIPLVNISANLLQNNYIVFPYLTLNFYGNGEHKYSIVLFHYSYRASPPPSPDRSYCGTEGSLYRFSQLLIDIRRPPASVYDSVYRTYDFISKCIPHSNSLYNFNITNLDIVIYSDTGDVNIYFDLNNIRYVIITRQSITMTSVDTVEVKYFNSYSTGNGEFTGMFSDSVTITQYPPPSTPTTTPTPTPPPTTIIAPEPSTSPQHQEKPTPSWLLIGLGIAVVLVVLLSLRKPEKFKEQSS